MQFFESEEEFVAQLIGLRYENRVMWPEYNLCQYLMHFMTSIYFEMTHLCFHIHICVFISLVTFCVGLQEEEEDPQTA